MSCVPVYTYASSPVALTKAASPLCTCEEQPKMGVRNQKERADGMKAQADGRLGLGAELSACIRTLYCSPWTALQARRTAGAWGWWWWWWHCGWTAAWYFGPGSGISRFLGFCALAKTLLPPQHEPCCFQTWTLPVPHQASDDLANFICFTSCQLPTQPQRN